MLKWINKKRNKKGFTLVELVVVIAILGILAGIAIPRLGKSRDSAKIATHNANVRILKSVATMYLADHPGAGSDDLKEDNLKEYLDGEKYPEIPKDVDGIDVGEGDGGKYKVSLDNGNIVVKPGETEAKEETEETP